MKTPTMTDRRLEKLSDLIDGIEYAMLTTREPDGTLHSRPLRTEAMQSDGTLLFFTEASSAKAKELTEHPQVSVTYMSGNAATCVVIAGHARLRRDPAKMKELWNDLYKVWFPKGLSDPDLVLLEVTIDRAEYWETANAVVRAVAAAKALATGEPIKAGGHEQMNLRPTD